MTHAKTRVILARHGEVDPAWHGRIYGSLDVPLSEAGRRQSARLAEALTILAPDAVVSSGLQRTEDTAAHLRSRLGAPRLDDPELRELDRGAWAGLSQDELERREPGAWSRWFGAPGDSRPPGGESLEDLRRRVEPRLEHWARIHAGGAVAIVTHGWVVRVLVCRALGAELGLAPRLDVRTGDACVLRCTTSPAGMRVELEAFALDLDSPQLSE